MQRPPHKTQHAYLGKQKSRSVSSCGKRTLELSKGRLNFSIRLAQMQSICFQDAQSSLRNNLCRLSSSEKNLSQKRKTRKRLPDNKVLKLRKRNPLPRAVRVCNELSVIE
ncbi:hypothetical protein TorRG33x02_119910 [Trema orientale]|uniref:Uncharacterized protein n=1 Tax=Trema orientale TaxID=63057 RepID=A0A2P5F330_TREOI|nr:hypothetical protein TorRG33x02_119910 [Trema orientale]